MNEYERRHGWLLAVGIVLLTMIAGGIAYNFGVSHGMAQVATDPDAAGHLRHWRGHWGYGFAPLGFLFLAFFWFGLMRRLIWGWGWGGPWRGPWGGHRYYAGWDDVPPPFENWHRQAHERMKERPPADDPGRRG